MKGSLQLIMLIMWMSLLGVSGCSKCDNCAPSQNYPYVNLRFYNIDSLVKIENSIVKINDSIQVVNDLIAMGNNDLSDVLNTLESNLNLLNSNELKIKQGKTRIDQLTATGSDHILYFKDSIHHDSLTNFRFPLSPENENTQFIISLPSRTDTLGLQYELVTKAYGADITRRAYFLSLLNNTYDSVKLICKHDSCLSNEAIINIYF